MSEEIKNKNIEKGEFEINLPLSKIFLNALRGGEIEIPLHEFPVDEVYDGKMRIRLALVINARDLLKYSWKLTKEGREKEDVSFDVKAKIEVYVKKGEKNV